MYTLFSTTAFFSGCCPQLQLHLSSSSPLPPIVDSLLLLPILDSLSLLTPLFLSLSLSFSLPPSSFFFSPLFSSYPFTRFCFLAFAFVALAVNLRSCLYIHPFCYYYLS